ncbi:MAG TPA: TlpA disulfide reductase family protein [Candidatus Limnocylindrales bacterium]|nr:TlpA disulfide reductase family protein [Candidatus Limnocylindrales bacterium]
MSEPGQPRAPRRTDRPLIGPFTVRHVTLLVVALAVTALLTVALNTPIVGGPRPGLPVPGSSFVPVGPAVEGLGPGDRAPELIGTVNDEPIELRDLDGNVIRLADLRGQVVWINFWASWCPPCQEETPVLRDVYERYRDQGLALIAISVQESSVEDVRRYVDTYGLSFTVGFDATSAVFQSYRAFGLPTQFFIDRDGTIQHIVLGPVTRDQAANLIVPMLAD